MILITALIHQISQSFPCLLERDLGLILKYYLVVKASIPADWMVLARFMLVVEVWANPTLPNHPLEFRKDWLTDWD